MADQDDYATANAALEKAIAELASKASTSAARSAPAALTYAKAANQLAEARAWLRSPGQPHGSSSSAD